MSTSSAIELASGQLNNADHLTVVLIKPDRQSGHDLDQMASDAERRLEWQAKETSAKITRILAAAQIEYAAQRL